MASRYAQVGDEGRCVRCGRVIEFREVAINAFTGDPVYRWVAVRKTKHAPIPIICPNHNTKTGPHMTATHCADGSPVRSSRDGVQ